MKPIDHVMAHFGLYFMNEITRRKVVYFLNENYPEATWEVEFFKDNVNQKIVINPVFKNPKDETFYRLMWS
jgi:hypothetical protein